MYNTDNTGGSHAPAPLDGRDQGDTTGGNQDQTLTLPPRDHGDRTTNISRHQKQPTLAESFRPTENALIEKAKSLRLYIPPSKLRSHSKTLSPETPSQNDIATSHHELQQSEFSRSNQVLTENSVPTQLIESTECTTSVSFSIIISCKANKVHQASSRSQSIDGGVRLGSPLLPSLTESGIKNPVASRETFGRSTSSPSSDSDHHMTGVEEDAPKPLPYDVNTVPGSSKNGNSKRLPALGSVANETSNAAPVTRKKRTPKYAGIPHVLLPFGPHAPLTPGKAPRKKAKKASSSDDSLVGAKEITGKGSTQVGGGEEGSRLQGHVVGASDDSLAKQASTSESIHRYHQNSSQIQHFAPGLPHSSPYTSPVSSQATSPAQSLAASMSGPSTNPPQAPRMASQAQPRVQGSSQTILTAPQNDAVWIARLSDGPQLCYPMDFQAPGSGLGMAPYNDHSIIAQLEAGYDCRVYEPSNFIKLLARSPDPKALVSAWRSHNPPQEAPGFTGMLFDPNSLKAQSLTLRKDRVDQKLLVFIGGIHNIRHLSVQLVELDKIIDPQTCTPAEKAVSQLAKDDFLKNALALSARAIQSGWLAHVDQVARKSAVAPLAHIAPAAQVSQASRASSSGVGAPKGAIKPQKSTPRQRNPLSDKFNEAKAENNRLSKENNALQAQLDAAKSQIAQLERDRDFWKLQVENAVVAPGKPYITPEAGRLYIFGQLVDDRNPRVECERVLPRDLGKQKAGEVCGHTNKFYIAAKESNYVWLDRQKCSNCKQALRSPFKFLDPENARVEMVFNGMPGDSQKALRTTTISTLPPPFAQIGVSMTPQPPAASTSGFALPPPGPSSMVPQPPVRLAQTTGLSLPQVPVRAVQTSSLTLPVVGPIEIEEEEDLEINALFEERSDDDFEALLRAALED